MGDTWISTHLTSEDTTDGLLGGAGSLVPRTLSSVGVIPDSSARAGESGAGQLGGSVGGIILGLGLVLADITLDLVATVASDAANSALDGTRGRVHVGLEGGGGGVVIVVGGHFD